MPRFSLSIEEELELDIQRLRETRQRAEEIVRDRGWTEVDEDFEIQVDEEAKVQWNEECERERRFEEEQEREEDLLWKEHVREMHRKNPSILLP